jgi:hypothetical protein
MIGKDKTGKYHPPKGKPSGSPKKANEHLTQDAIIEDASKTVSNDALENTHVRHNNRQVSKDPESKSLNK